jgi:hypothetical protein
MSMGGLGGKRASPLYNGLTNPAVILPLKFPKVGFVVGCVGKGSDFGAGQRLKFVVLPLKAFIFRENFAEGSDAKEVSLEFGFKLIL